MRIQNNIMALNTHRMYGVANGGLAGSAEKLSSGYRINRAGDDAAGLAISEKMRAQIRGLTMASKNSQDAISLIQTAEGALQSTHNILQRMRELAVQSASDTNETTIDRAALDAEFQQLVKEIDDTADKTRFNDQNLIDGTFQKYSAVLKSTGVVGSHGNFGVSMSASVVLGNANVGEYEFQIVQKTTGYVAAASFTSAMYSNLTTAVKTTSSGGVATTGITYTEALASVRSQTASYNGDWQIKYDAEKSEFYAVKGDETIYANKSLTSAAGTTTGLTLDFDKLGKIELTFDATFADASVAQITAKVEEVGYSLMNSNTVMSVSNGVDEELGETKFYARLTGAQDVEVEVGETAASFSNGITLKFNALTSAQLTRKNTGTSNVPEDKSFVFDAAGAGGTTDYRMKITVGQVQGKSMIIQSGANQGDEFAINIDQMNALFLGVKFSSIASQKDASYAITQTNRAINQVSTQRAALGAMQNRLGHKIANLDTSAENLTAAESRIRDVDMAKEMTNFTKQNILVQAATAMLAQANSAPQNVLSLLR